MENTLLQALVPTVKCPENYSLQILHNLYFNVYVSDRSEVVKKNDNDKSNAWKGSKILFLFDRPTSKKL